LEEGFRPNLSLEDLSCLGLQQKVAIPMVSFCDIPLSQTKAHMQYYGHYGIGLSKSWGREKGINPVLYTYQGSPLAVSLSQSLAWTYAKYLGIRKLDPFIPHEAWARIASIFRGIKKDATRSKQYLKLWDKLLRLQCFIKPYEGLSYKTNPPFQNVRFYDEREWRFVPELREDLYKYLLYEEEYNNEPACKKATNEIHARSKLSFESTDIKYIIIHHDEEIVSMIEKIQDIKPTRYSTDEIKVLSSKLISAQQIATDL
jgi:hypothetical protein